MNAALLRHARTTLALALFTMLLLAVQVQAQPVNDDLADAIEVASAPFTDTGTNVDATSETDETYPGNSVWWKITPSQAGILKVDTYGSGFDTFLSLWTGSGHPLTRHAFNDDAGGTDQSELGMAVEIGTTYYIRVRGTYSSYEGSITLNVSLEPPLANDDLVDATEITSLPFAGTGSNFGATVETDETSPSYACASGHDIDNSVWWTYTPAQDGILNVDTYGSSFNTNLSVWTGTDHPLAEETCAGQRSSGDQTEVKLAVAAGETYYIRVAGVSSYGAAVEGDVTINVAIEPPITNDDLAGAIEITSLPFNTTGSNYGATQETDETLPSCTSQADKSVWWTYTAAEDGILTADTEGSDLSAELSIWSGSGHPLTEIACNDGYSSKTVSTPIVAGETYYVRIADRYSDGSLSEEGDFSLSVTREPPITNDDLADATAITSLPFSDTGSNAGATGESGEADSACSSSSGASNSVWWEYAASQDGVLTIDTDGSDFDRVLSLWTGSGHPLDEEQCTDDSPEKIVHSVASGETYYIRVSGYSDSGEGDISLSVTLGPPLVNDDLADAIDITSTPYSGTSTTVGATLETDEVITTCGDESGQEGSVWWTYTASQAGKLTIDTGGSTFDLVLSVWTGSSHPLDSAGCTDSDSGAELEVSSGETYYIRISNYYGDETGDISLSATFALPDPIYVDVDATGANDGSSWADAYTSLHDALADGDPEIWVAEGTYSNGTTSFDLPNGTRVYGGFNGTETARTERDPAQHATVLTGLADHVLYTRSVGSSTRLDGLTVSGGTADGGGDDDHGGGLYCDGRGIYGSFSGGCSLTIRDVIFQGNTADGDGGAIYLDGRSGGSANPTLVGVTFLNNSGTHGGALYLNAEGSFASPTLENVVFADNNATNGGAIYSWAGLQGTASPQFVNVVFANNTAIAGGGAVFNTQAGGAGGWATPTFTNVTFFGNTADTQGHAIWNYAMGDGEAAVSLHNVVAWNNMNEAQTGSRFNNQGSATTAFVDAIVESASGVCYNSAVSCTRVLDEDPEFRADWNPDGADNTYRTGDDGLRLASYSPAIDAGDNLASTAASDLAGNPRVFGGAIDLGAYEHAAYQSASDAPDVGSGMGFYQLGSTGATVLFSANASSSGGLSASLTESMPSGSGLPDNLVQQYWTITESLDGSFTYNVTFDLTGVGGISDFSALKVYKSNDGGQTWAELDSLIHNEADHTITAANLTSFSDFAVGDATNALPVELAGVQAVRDDDVVRLRWRTASEINNARFDVERRVGDAGWTTVGSVKGAGTTTEAQSYAFADEGVPFEAEALSYRLKQIDFDGTAAYSAEVEVASAQPQAFALHGSFPNPFRKATTIRYELPEAAQVTLDVYDALGRRVRTLVDERQETGRKVVRFEANDLPAGTYFYRLQADGHTETQRMVHVR